MSDHVPVRQWQSTLRRAHEGILDHFSPADEWPDREAKSHTSYHAEGLMLTMHGPLGQALAAGDERVQ